jgi:hypothetical protein
LITEAKKAYPVKFVGLYQMQDESTKIQVTTGRTRVAFLMSDALVKGGRYSPPPALRLDVLIVDCGDHDIGEVFECSRVTLKTQTGKQIKPHWYKAQPNTYKNALGSSWSVREVAAIYPIDGLIEGFSIDYANPTGTEWTFSVTAAQAADDLLLGLKSIK